MSFKRYVIYILMVTILISMIGCKSDDAANTNNKDKITIAVSIVPQETFVKAVAGDLVNIVTMIPPGHSPTNYQPTPKQMTDFSKASVYFSIGVPTEESNIIPKINDLNKDIKVISLAKKVREVYPYRNFNEDEEHQHDNDNNHKVNEDHDDSKDHEGNNDHDHLGRDPHIWLSPKRVKIMLDVIKDELIKLDPDNKAIYERNSSEFIAKLEEVDNNIKDILSGLEQQSFIIYHPSFGYFAEDYGLKMITIEEEGKEATAKRLQNVIDYAKDNNIKFIFYQQEFDSGQAETIAKEVGGSTVKVSPLGSNYLKNLEYIANKFKEVLK